uniref:Fatty acyl-CoA reductase n=1 Tax=Clastoptera arizonana TaxID=38151 RepID=A0A1B6CHA6_9HEMI
MEFYPKDDLDISFIKPNIESKIQQIYSGCHIFLTGSTGFIGKFLLEKLLRSCDIAQVYILIRQKKGMASDERLEYLFQSVFFERLLIANKNARNLITLIEGDLTLPDLGLSQGDLNILHNKIDFVFHCAATLNMMEHLRTAININVNATMFLLEQAKLMKKLKAFVYVSTAYSHAMLYNIEEKFYPTKYNAEEIKLIVNTNNDDQLTALTPQLLEDWPNTYVFTKAIAENLVSTYHEIPVVVVRPAQIISSVFEPLKGYVDNIYGPIATTLGAATGFLKVWSCDGNVKSFVIPVDIVVNSILSIAWYTVSYKTNSTENLLRVFNLVPSKDKIISINHNFEKFREVFCKEKVYSSYTIGPYNMKCVKNESLYRFFFILFHVIPPFFVDVVLKLFGYKQRVLPIYRKVYLANKILAYFCTKDYNFSDKNSGKLWSLMNSKDKEIFNFDQNSYTYEEYYRNCVRGGRVYLTKDPMDTVPAATKRYKRVIFLNILFKAAFYLIIGIFFINFI